MPTKTNQTYVVTFEIIQEDINFDTMFPTYDAYMEYHKMMRQLLLESAVTKAHAYHDSIVDMYAVMVEAVLSSQSRL